MYNGGEIKEEEAQFHSCIPLFLGYCLDKLVRHIRLQLGYLTQVIGHF
jgi:hypothetical protein